LKYLGIYRDGNFVKPWYCPVPEASLPDDPDTELFSSTELPTYRRTELPILAEETE
jgi:hypothetical protein